jgi:hypothetical protein
LGLTIDIEPYVWRWLELPGLAGIALPPEKELPDVFRWEIYLSNPRDIFIVPLPLTLADDRSQYHYQDLTTWKFHKRTVWRRRMPKSLSRLIERFTQFR